MIATQDAHVRTPAAAALDDHFGRLVEDAHEGERAGGVAFGRAHEVAPGTQVGEIEAGAAAGLVDAGHVGQGLEDAFDGILHRQDEAGGELGQAGAGVHQGGRIGHELAVPHHAVEGVFRFAGLQTRAIIGLGLGHVMGHAAE